MPYDDDVNRDETNYRSDANSIRIASHSVIGKTTTSSSDVTAKTSPWVVAGKTSRGSSCLSFESDSPCLDDVIEEILKRNAERTRYS